MDVSQDNGLINSSYQVFIPFSEQTPGVGAWYILDTLDHDLPVKEETANAVDGTFNGGSAVRQQEKLAVKIWAVTGAPAPAQLVRFALAVHGYTSKFWKVTNLKIATGTGVQRAYSADITQAKNLIT